MSFNPDMYEKLIAARHAEILRDVQQSRIQPRAGQGRSSGRPAIGRLSLPGSQLRALRQSGASLS